MPPESQLSLDILSRRGSLLVNNHVAAIIAVAEEDDFDSKIITRSK